MNNKMKAWMLAGVLAVVTTTGTAAWAANGTGQAPVPAAEQEAAQDGHAMHGAMGKMHDGMMKMMKGMGMKGEHGKHMMIMNEELFTLLNITKEEFRTQKEAGKSLKEIAEAKGITEQQLIDFFTKQHDEHLAQLVKDGKLTQEQADEMKANHPEMIKKMIESTGPMMGKMGGHGKMMKGGHLMILNDELFKLLNITKEEFRTEKEAGKSLKEIAEAKGITEQQLTDFFTKQHDEHLAQLVKDGKLTQEQADEMKAKHPEMIKQLIEGTGPMMGKMGGMKMKMKDCPMMQNAPAPAAPTEQAPTAATQG